MIHILGKTKPPQSIFNIIKKTFNVFKMITCSEGHERLRTCPAWPSLPLSGVGCVLSNALSLWKMPLIMMWGRTGDVWTPNPRGSTPPPCPAQFFPPYRRPIFSLFFFSGTPAQNSEFCPRLDHAIPSQRIFRQKHPYPRPLISIAPSSPTLMMWLTWPCDDDTVKRGCDGPVALL